MRYIILIMMLSLNIQAATKTFKSLEDSRIEYLTYSEKQVYPLQLHNKYQTTIVLANYERILVDTLSFGYDSGKIKSATYIAMIIPGHENEITIRPGVENAPPTNLRFKTDAGRIYRFNIPKPHFKTKRIPKDLAFEIIFNYPNKSLEETLKKQKQERDILLKLAFTNHIKPTPKDIQNKKCDQANLEHINIDYHIEGDMDLRPESIFDDGKFTYIKFKKEMGVIVALDTENQPSNVNFHVDNCGVFIVHSVRNKFALTKNGRAACITNKSFKKKAE